ncbi:uncharacterized protein CC84DRAFT_1262262 [Paraphaeosphaeria sporulosa]|uniref:Structure-specific endonuclease subunit SLX4 n=1 Tax=Paraphaeosphaeria sporulosa TaxID=1460663 RepID=A0A177C3V0_9PLEO|nr:uncharacterized protein CC84DRAFT_1262262 [Paraphaeosphaeria sporulosa]OAG02303.1 hypothetical protein CC84DRAFT_1262262 [Paraphaeosphaeria sporulosa]
MAGATYDIVVLSSSPPDSLHVGPRALSPASPLERRVAMPASPLRSLSPPPIPKRAVAGASLSGSRAAPVPMGVERGFATARSLLADISINDRGLSAIEEALESRRVPTGPENTIKASKPARKRATKATAVDEDAAKPKAKPKPRGRKPKTTSAEKVTSNASNAEATATTSSYFAKLPGADVAASTREPAAAPPEPKPRKPRTKKATTDNGEIQTTIKKVRVTKPRGATKITKKVQEKAAEVASAHFRSRGAEHHTAGLNQPDTTVAGGQSARVGDDTIWDVPLSPSARSNGPPKQRPPDPDDPLDLDEAVSRRRDWTPPPDTKRQEILTSSTGKENKPVAEKESFTSLLSGYSYARMETQSQKSASETACTEVTGAMKRRRLELLDLPNHQVASRQASPEKGKAPKKKPRTITDLVTGQYAPQQPLPDSPEVSSDFFARRTTPVPKTTKVSLNDMADEDSTKVSKKPVRKRSTSKPASKPGEAKGKPKKTSAKAAAKPKLVAETLLSPASALSRLNRQDVLFGTSSQLAREESPTMVRDLQNAIRESEQDAELRHSLASNDAPAFAAWPRLQRIEGRRALWKASSRDDEGHTLERQSVCLPEPDRTQDFPLVIDKMPEQSDDSFLDINDFAPPPQAPISISSDLSTPPSTVVDDNAVTAEARAAIRSPCLDMDNFLSCPPPVAGSKEVAVEGHFLKSSPFRDINDFPRDLPPSNQPVDSSFLDINDFILSTRTPAANTLPTLASTGSPKKPRDRPPKSQSAIRSRVPASAPVRVPKKPIAHAQSSTATSPSTPRKSQNRFHSIEAILDSEDDEALSPTPPRARPLAHSPPLPLVFDTTPNPAKDTADGLVPIYRIPETKLTFDGIRPTLFPALTSLIRSLPPSTDASKPSWHEKILMYDAIVAEDFTAFLNTHDHIHTYKRATQKQIKAWNKELRARREEEMKVVEGEGMVLAVEKEIEAYMVQKWCEEMSVCCVFKERKNGGARKGLY